jgi:hypothetical protein
MAQMFGEFLTGVLALRAKMTRIAASELHCACELLFVADVSPADVGNVGDFAPCG